MKTNVVMKSADMELEHVGPIFSYVDYGKRKHPGIYVIKNTIDHRIYIGSTNCMIHRWRNHKNQLKRGVSKNPNLQEFVNKHGIDKLHFIAFEYCELSKIKEREQFYIDVFEPFKYGFNVSPSAKDTKGVPCTDSKRINISKSRIGMFLGGESPRAKSIIQLDLNGNYIREWDSISEARRVLGLKLSHIAEVCKGERSHNGGYKWKYKDAA